MKGLLRFFRSLAIGTLPVLLFAIVLTFYYKPEFLSRDGLMMIRDQIAIGTRQARPPAEVADWGHDTIPPPNPNIARIAALARSRDYDALEAIYRDDPDTYFFFNDSSPDLGTDLDTWIGARPASAAARTARGSYWRALGWRARGGGYARETSADQFEAMRTAFTKAEADLRAAIGLNRAGPTPYRHLIGIYAARGREEEVVGTWQRALENGAADTLVHAALFNFLVPWWSGPEGDAAPRLVRQLVEAIETADPNGLGDVELLRHFPEFIEAEILWRAKQRDAAMEKYRTFIQGRAGLMHLDNYASHLSTLGRHAEALPYFAERLRFSPNDDGVREDYGYALIKLRHYDKAARELDRALAADPYAPRALRLRGDAAYRLGAFAEAEGFYECSKVYNPGRAWTWFRVGIIKREHTGDLPGAIENLRRAVELSGDWPAYRYGFGVALDHARDCTAVREYQRYQQLCEAAGDCGETTSRWVRLRLEVLIGRELCDAGGNLVGRREDWWPIDR